MKEKIKQLAEWSTNTNGKYGSLKILFWISIFFVGLPFLIGSFFSHYRNIGIGLAEVLEILLAGFVIVFFIGAVFSKR